MNSRSSVNETNLVNFSTDLPTLNQLDAKDGLLSFPFDHIYACHSESSEHRQTLQLDKEVEISTQCAVAEEKEVVVSTSPDITQLSERLAIAENQNKKLKDLLIYHLDLIQQQNEQMTKRDKLFINLKQENETLKSRLTRMDRRVTISQRQSVNPSSVVHVPKTPVTSTVVKSEPGQIMLNSFTELLLPDNRANSFLFDGDLDKSKPFGQDSFEIPRPSESDVTNYLSPDLGVASILDSNINCEDFTMIESKPSFAKKEMKTETREALYTVTSNSGNPVIQRIQRSRRKTSTSLGSLSRMSKSTASKTDVSESNKAFEDKSYDRTFNVNKKSKMINTYGKSKSSTSTLKRTSQFTGSLSDRLRLIDTTPTGEDPYQLGEADMREQSPIPKLMLQKTNHGRMKICTDTNSTTTTTSSRRSYSSIKETNTKAHTKIKLDKYNLPNPYRHPTELQAELQSELQADSPKTAMVEDPDLDLIKTEPEIDWRLYNPNKPGNETSLCDFSYGETPNNLASSILDSVEFQDLFSSDGPLNLDNLNTETEFATTTPVKKSSDKSKKRGARTSSLIGQNFAGEEPVEVKKSTDTKRGRKRALSTTGLPKKKRENARKSGAKPKPKRTRGKGACRGKKSPVPGMFTKRPYHTLVGDPDLSWYLGLDPDVKPDDVDAPGETFASTVEVPRWREKPYTSCYTMEGTEDLDDKVFEKRHQKLEAEERRQLRWHMRRVREQRHVERLRERQRDSWSAGGTSPAEVSPLTYTVWPMPIRDLHYIEITDELPITAFGEAVPNLPESEFMLPWVRKTKASKRSKRSKTLH